MQNLAEFAAANPWLVLGLVASGLAVLFNELRLKARDVGSLSAPVAVRLINSGSRVIDVREPDKFSAGHIVDARNEPADKLLADPEVLKKSKKNVVLVCDSGSRSAELAAQFRKNGLENVFSLKGGLMAWRQENLPLVRDESRGGA